MPKFENFEKWIEERWATQTALAEKLGVAKNTVSLWASGRSKIKGDAAKKIRNLGYDGPFPHEKTAEPQGDYITREEFAEYRGATAQRIQDLRDNLEDYGEVIRFLLTQLPEGSRPGVLPKRFR